MNESQPSLLSISADDRNADIAAQSLTNLNQLLTVNRVSFYEGLDDKHVY